MSSLAASVAKSVAQMSWVTEADQAAVDLAMRYAHQIDTVAELVKADPSKTQELTKAYYLGPHLLRTLGELGGTPAGRRAMDEGTEDVSGTLSRLRGDSRKRRGSA